MVGPLIGNFMNNSLGYFPAFLTFAALLAVSGIINLILQPNSLNSKPIISSREFSQRSAKTKKEVKMTWFLTCRRSIFALISLALLGYFVNFKQAFLTVVLEKDMGIAQAYHGAILAIPAFFSVISATLTGLLINYAPRRVFMLMSFFLLGISNILMGPSELLNLQEVSALFFIGYAINGFAQGLCLTPLLPEMMDSIYIKQEIIEGEDENIDSLIADKASAVYGSIVSFGAITGPLAGSLVYDILT
jgi:MFS family permease